MAGIGFELKKIFKGKSILMTTGGYFYATFVSVGPILVCVGLMMVIRMFLRSLGVDIQRQNLFQTGVMYSFMLSLIFSGALSMLLSRYIADCIYSNHTEKILPACYGALALGLGIVGCVGAVFYIIVDLPIIFELLCYMLLMELHALFLVMVFVSAVKDYKRITWSFIIGALLGLLTAVLGIWVIGWDVVYTLLLALDMCFLVTVLMIIYHIYCYFYKSDESYFDFFKYVAKLPSLVFINLFYMISLFIHNVIIWQSELGIRVADVFVSAPVYDVPAFLALLTVLPAMVMFVVKTETTFYDHYREYIKMLAGGGTLKDLTNAGDAMRNTLYNELIMLLQVQLMISILCIIGGKLFFSQLGFSEDGFAFFGYLCIGYYCIIAVHIISSIILYFDDRKSALHIMTVFLVSHVVFVIISLYMGTQVYGLGTAVAGIISVIYALIKLQTMTNSLDYRLYCSQPITNSDQKQD